MANAKKCDICGVFYDSPKHSDSVQICLVNLGHMKDRYIDLCDTCYDKLCDFVAPTIPEGYSVERYKGGKDETNP